MIARISYQKAGVSYIDDIVEFQVQMAKETENLELNREVTRKGAAAIFDDPRLGQYYVCLSDGELAGCLLIQNEWSDWRNGNVWWVHSVFIRPEFRGRGLFQGLYEYVKSLMLHDPSVRGIRLYVDKTNTSAQKVYEKMGMNGDHYKMFEWMKTF